MYVIHFSATPMYSRIGLLLLFVLVFSVESKGQRDAFSLEAEFAKQHKLYPHISSVLVGDTSLITIHRNCFYTKEKCYSRSADIYLPKQINRSIPVVILVHGGGWQSGDKQLDGAMAAHLARHDVAAVCINYRLSDEAPYPAAIVDISCAIRWVRSRAKHLGFDPKQITLLGSSAGGQMVSLLGAINGRHPSFGSKEHRWYSCRVQKVVDIDGVLAFVHPDSSEGHDKPDKLSAASRWFGVSIHADSALWHGRANEASALNHVNRRSARFLFCLSGQTRFSAGVHDMVRELERYGNPAKVVRQEGSPHTHWLFHPWFEPLMKEVVEFVKDDV